MAAAVFGTCGLCGLGSRYANLNQANVTATPTPTPGVANNVANPSNKVKKPKPDRQTYGATARCADGTLSYSAHRQGTCSHHGGVAEWY
jgi:hypothetical protein